MASWKKVVLRGDNITDEQLTVTAATLVAGDSLVFADADDNYLKSETMANVATLMAGTGSATGLAASSGVLGLKTDLTALSPLVNSGGAGVEDFLIVYDQSANQWKKALASTVGSAGSDTNTTYALSAADTSNTQATLTLTAGGSGSGDDNIVFQSETDATIDTDATEGAEIIKIGVSTTPTNITSIFNADIEMGTDTNNCIDFGANSNQIQFRANSNVQFTIQDGALVPSSDGAFDLGLTGTRLKEGFFKDLEVTNEITGSVSGSAGSAGTATTVSTAATDSETTVYIAGFINNNSTAQTPQVTSGIHFDSSSDKITAGGFVGALEGNADTATSATDATNADNLAITDRAASSSNQYFVFSEGTSGDQALGVDSNFYYVPDTDTLNVQNLVVSGTETKVNTTNLSVTDKIVEIATGSADAAAANGAGIQVNIDEVAFDATANNDAGNQDAVNLSFAKMPELKWNNDTILAGWTISDYNSAAANTDHHVAIMNVDSAAPSGTTAQAGAGSLYTDTSTGTEALYVYL